MRGRLKKFITSIICLATALLFTLPAGCGKEVPPAQNPSQGSTGGGSVIAPAPPPEQGKEEPFKVTLISNGRAFTPQNFSVTEEQLTAVTVVWTSVSDFGESAELNTANCNAEGVATAELDGDYTVTLANLPAGYTYNPYLYIADDDGKEVRFVSAVNNYEKKIKIQIYKVQSTKRTVTTPDGNGGTYKWLQIGSTYGAYRATINSPDEIVRFAVSANMQGLYSITSILDVSENNVKAKLTQYNATFATYFGVKEVVSDGGASASYTKNFRWEATFDRSQATNVSYYFGITAEKKSGTYPVTVDFIYSRDGDFEYNFNGKTVVSEWDFDSHPVERPEGSKKMFTDLYCKQVVNAGTSQEREIINLTGAFSLTRPTSLIELGEDGFYRMKDTGKLVYVSFTDILSFGIKVSPTQTRSINVLLENNTGAPQSILSAEKYNLCNRNYDPMIDLYKEHLVDGCYPVNEELRKFLVDLSAGRQLFYDNYGSLEADPANCISDNASQWLIMCCLFV